MLPIPHWTFTCLSKTTIKALKQGVKCIATIDFGLTSVFFINSEHLSHATLVLVFILWRGKCWLKVHRELFFQNNTVMVTYTHNHAPEILLWQCSCHRNKKNSFKLQKSFFNYDANLTSVIAMELKFLFSLRCWFLCMMSLALTSAILKTSVKFWGTSFKFWLCPWFGKRYVCLLKRFLFLSIQRLYFI